MAVRGRRRGGMRLGAGSMVGDFSVLILGRSRILMSRVARVMRVAGMVFRVDHNWLRLWLLGGRLLGWHLRLRVSLDLLFALMNMWLVLMHAAVVCAGGARVGRVG